MSALTTPAHVKNYMRLHGDEHDGTLEQLIAAASDAVERYCRRPFGLGDASECFDGPGAPSVFLRRRPVGEIRAVWDDPTRRFDPATALPASAYMFDPDTGILTRTVGRFGYARRSIRVDYRGGFATPPPSLVQAVDVLVAHYFLRGRQGGDGVASESMGAYTVSFDATDWPGTAKTLLAEFREWSL